MIEVQGLRKEYGDLIAVDDVAFTAEDRAIFGLLGPNGAGKSTTIGCICGLLEPSAGRLRVMGYDVLTEGAKARGCLGVLSANVLAALGGCWWPIEITPAWMQTFSKFLPTGTTMDALHQLVNFGAPAARAIPHAVALLLAALAVGWLSARMFRFE